MKEYKIAICVPIKDETEYLKEWLDWHFDLGITDIYLYEDDNSVSHLDIINQYNNAHFDKISRVFFEEYPSDFQFTKRGAWKQSYLYHYFYNKYRDKYDWIMFIDIDEFLILKKPLQEILNEFKNNPAIKFKWRIMTANGHIKKPAGNVMDNYTEISYIQRYICALFMHIYTHRLHIYIIYATNSSDKYLSAKLRIPKHALEFRRQLRFRLRRRP